MILYQDLRSPFVLRVRIAIYAKGLHDALTFTPPPDGFGSQAFRSITPLGKVPTLVLDDGTVVPESEIINEFLEDRFPEPSLLPADPAPRATARAITRIADNYVMAPYLPLFRTVEKEGIESAAVRDGLARVRAGLAYIEHFIGTGSHAVGERLTLADCGLVPMLRYLDEYAETWFGMHEPLAPFPRTTAYWARIQADPHVARGLEDIVQATTRT